MSNPLTRLKATIQRNYQETGRNVGRVNNVHSTIVQTGNRIAAELAGSTGVAEVRADYERAVKNLEEARNSLVRAETVLREMGNRVQSI